MFLNPCKAGYDILEKTTWSSWNTKSKMTRYFCFKPDYPGPMIYWTRRRNLQGTSLTIHRRGKIRFLATFLSLCACVLKCWPLLYSDHICILQYALPLLFSVPLAIYLTNSIPVSWFKEYTSRISMSNISFHTFEVQSLLKGRLG